MSVETLLHRSRQNEYGRNTSNGDRPFHDSPGSCAALGSGVQTAPPAEAGSGCRFYSRRIDAGGHRCQV
jgi:hypothetical protein